MSRAAVGVPIDVEQLTGVAAAPAADGANGGGAAPAPVGGQRYEKLERPLGEGTFGIVYKARDLTTGELVAMKRLPMGVWTEGMPATALREISVLKEIAHPNIVHLRDVFVSYNGNLYLVFELMDCDLKAIQDGARSLTASLPPPAAAAGGPLSLPTPWVKWLLLQLLCAIDACHAHRVVHRDIKPQNILFNKASGTLKLADFGLARTFAVPLRTYTHEVVTLWYRCPEILLGATAYSTAVDMWSAGCIFAEMAVGEPFFQGGCEIDQIIKIFQKLGTPTPAVWPTLEQLADYQPSLPKFAPRPWARLIPTLGADGHDLLARMLAYNPQARITAREALAHPFLAGAACPPQRLETALQEVFAARCSGGRGGGAGATAAQDPMAAAAGSGAGAGWEGGGGPGGGWGR